MSTEVAAAQDVSRSLQGQLEKLRVDTSMNLEIATSSQVKTHFSVQGGRFCVGLPEPWYQIIQQLQQHMVLFLCPHASKHVCNTVCTQAKHHLQ